MLFEKGITIGSIHRKQKVNLDLNRSLVIRNLRVYQIQNKNDH